MALIGMVPPGGEVIFVVGATRCADWLVTRLDHCAGSPSALFDGGFFDGEARADDVTVPW